MRVDVSYKYMEKSGIVEDIIDKNLDKISRRIAVFKHDDPIHVSLHLEKNPNKQQFFCRSTVYLPSKVLHVQETSSDISKVITKTFGVLSRQMAKLKFKVESSQKRRARAVFETNPDDEL
jgi:ribosome-associated translation inhibitor RaiA